MCEHSIKSKIMKHPSTLLLLFSVFIFVTPTFAQVCNPDEGFTCEDAYVFCSLEVMDGFICRNPPPPNEVGPEPICDFGGIPQNTHWLLFVAESDSTAISITPSRCTSVGGMIGLQAVIYTDCSFEEVVICSEGCFSDSTVLSFPTEPCKSYLLMIDGCGGSECDYELEILTGKNTQPSLDSISLSAPDSICINAPLCMSVNTNLTCHPEFLWRIDGDTLDSNHRAICEIIPTPGSIEVCVKAYTGRVGDYCDSTDWVCDTVIVFIGDTIHLPRETLCYEDRFGNFSLRCATPVPSTPGLHQICCEDTSPSGCKYTLCKEFYIRDRPTEGADTIIVCEDEPVILPGHGPVFCGEYVSYVDDGGPLGCDTVIVYQVASIEPSVNMLPPNCIGGSVCLQAQAFFTCQVVSPEATTYWFDRITGEILEQNTDLLCVDEPGEYCFIIQSAFGNTLCTPQQYCIKAPDLRPGPLEIIGDKVTCLDSASYYVDTAGQRNLSYQWTVSEGEIVGPIDRANVELDLSDVTGDEIELCLTLTNNCGTADPQCQTIEIAPDSLQANFDVNQVSDSTFFTANAPGAVGYMWQFGDGSSSSEKDPFHRYDSPGTYTVQLIVYNQCERDTFDREITIVFTATRNHGPAGELDIFPNPSSGKVTAILRTSATVSGELRVRLVDVSGRLHFEQAYPASFFDDGLILDFNAIPSGVYLFMVEGERLRFERRLVLTGQ